MADPPIADPRAASDEPSDPNRLVCYCFEHSEAELLADLRANGVSTIRQSIKEACAAGRDDCARKNPKGRCCLGDVGRILKAAGLAEPARSCCARRNRP